MMRRLVAIGFLLVGGVAVLMPFVMDTTSFQRAAFGILKIVSLFGFCGSAYAARRKLHPPG
jgi:hypothetical protein